MRDRVETALAKIRPSLVGVGVTLIDASDGTVKVRMFGSSCGGMSEDVALEILEEFLREEVPEVEEVVTV